MKYIIMATNAPHKLTQFSDGIIINVQIIRLDMECSNEDAHYNSGGNGISQKSVHADQGTESDVKSHLCSSLDFMKETRMTFDEFTAVHGFLLQPKKPMVTKKKLQTNMAGQTR